MSGSRVGNSGVTSATLHMAAPDTLNDDGSSPTLLSNLCMVTDQGWGNHGRKFEDHSMKK